MGGQKAFCGLKNGTKNELWSPEAGGVVEALSSHDKEQDCGELTMDG